MTSDQHLGAKHAPAVTMVVTSHKRFDYLKRTLTSFFETNDYPLEKIIVIEDSDDARVLELPTLFPGQPLEIVLNGNNLGQRASIDKAYALVDTEYIYHCEEDWFFGRAGIIAESMAILEAEPNTLMVLARTEKNMPKYIKSLSVQQAGVARYRRIGPKVHYRWYTFSFNPGLRRKSDWLSIDGGYASIDDHEMGLSQHFKSAGRDMAWLVNGQVEHIGTDTTHTNKLPITKSERIGIWLQSLRRKYAHYLRMLGLRND